MYCNSEFPIRSADAPRADLDRHRQLLDDLNRLWSLPHSPGREAQMDCLILLIDEQESVTARRASAS